MAKAPVLLCILDGWGRNDNSYGNAVKMARTPNFDAICAKYPVTYLRCQGEAVGLRDGLMGNSEVGHENLGAGRTVLQEILFIDLAIDDGSFFEKPAFVEAAKFAKEHGGRLHFGGLSSDGGVHSAEKHYLAFLDFAKQMGFGQDEVLFHAFTDGRDTDPHSAAEFLPVVEQHMAEIGIGRIATIVGRYWAMDRDTRWHRTKVAYDAMVHGENRTLPHDTNPDNIDLSKPYTVCGSVEQALKAGYAETTDEFLWPTLMTGDDGQVLPRLGNGDAFILFNFRGDRPRQILRALNDDDFAGFDRGEQLSVALASLTQYDSSLPVPFGFKRERPASILGEVVSAHGLTQIRAAETEKYPHVTFFFNNQREEPYPGETRIMVKSPPVATYDLQPEMSAYRLAGAVIDSLHEADVAVVNFANPDMVGHTGVFEAAVKACEAVDQCLGQLLARLQELGGRALVTADHGNAEEMINYAKIQQADGSFDYTLREPHTTHTPDNLTPCVLVDDSFPTAAMREGGCLGDVAPTMLKMLGIEQPVEMTGKPLF